MVGECNGSCLDAFDICDFDLDTVDGHNGGPTMSTSGESEMSAIIPLSAKYKN